MGGDLTDVLEFNAIWHLHRQEEAPYALNDNNEEEIEMFENTNPTVSRAAGRGVSAEGDSHLFCIPHSLETMVNALHNTLSTD